jgi:cyclin E
MRLLLLDWMMEVCDEFALKRETYHLAAYFTDLYLTKEYSPVDQLQLLGASSLLLACKMEEVVCPRVKDFSFATDNGFTD